MSALLAPVESPTQAPGDRLRSLPSTPPRLARLPFLIVLAVIVAAGMAGVVVLSVNLQERASMLSSLRTQDSELGYQEASLQAQLDEESSVTSLSQRAYRLGMRPDPAPAFLHLDSGAVTGTPTPVTGREMPAQDPGSITREAVAGLTGTSTASAAPSATASASSKPAPSATASESSKPAASAEPSASATPTAPSKPAASATAGTKPTGGH